VWIGGGCLSAHLPVCNPLVDGAGDAMSQAIHEFVGIGHPPGANINEWVEVVAAEAEWATDG
jgi:hypothetical protein